MICEKIYKKNPANRIVHTTVNSISTNNYSLIPRSTNSIRAHPESSFMKLTDDWLRQIPAAIAAIISSTVTVMCKRWILTRRGEERERIFIKCVVKCIAVEWSDVTKITRNIFRAYLLCWSYNTVCSHNTFILGTEY